MRRSQEYEPNLPKKVKVGWRDYKIIGVNQTVAAQNARYGATMHLSQEMHVQVEGVDSRQTAHTLLHEILHAVCYMFNTLADLKGGDDGGEGREEHIVTTIADGLSQVFRDNPAVAEYLCYHHAYGYIMNDEIIFPDPTKWWVKVLRFGNALDDAHNMLSPTKMNLWSSILGVFGTAIATALSWWHGSISGIEHLWAPAGTWLGHSFTAHHYDKKERNRTAVALTAAQNGVAAPTDRPVKYLDISCETVLTPTASRRMKRLVKLSGPELVGMLDRGWIVVNRGNSEFEFQKLNEDGHCIARELDEVWHHDLLCIGNEAK